MNNNHGRRRTRRARNQQKQRKAQLGRILLTACLMGLIAVVSIGGTIAWLTAKTSTITNTFETTDIKITLTETEGFNDEGKWENQLIPGKTYPKNPIVSVVDDDTNVDVYLFVKFDNQNKKFETTDAEGRKVEENYLKFTSTLTAENGWKLVSGETNVYWREVKDGAETQSWSLIENDEVTVNYKLTKELTKATENMPTLSYTAYAIQTEGFTYDASAESNKYSSLDEAVKAAWQKVPN